MRISLLYNKNKVVRRVTLLAAIPFGAVACLFIALGMAVKEYWEMVAGTPEEFRRIWHLEP